jgi:DNA-binding NarL/FixJ family response regulator
VLDMLVGCALSRKRTWLFRRKLAPRSQPMLAALSALAWTWAQDPQAMKVLALAARDQDSNVQNAIRARAP